MSSIEISTALSDQDRESIIQGVVDAIRPLLETRPELVAADTMTRIAGISTSTLDRLRRDGLVPSVKVGTRRLYRPDAVIAALEASNKKREADHHG